ncbi:hypothetical protein PSCICG_21230 [Pseudomonas cichorii]|nr:hypothetical protein PSCICG_21230 [Pseudomonas cichorii]
MFNVTRRETAPESLHSRSWRGRDVAEALRKDFLDKCYICEGKEPICFNVEHFDAHKGDEDKKYDWTNLYFCCSRCNNFKGAKYNVLDCTDPSLDVCRLLRHVPPATPYSKHLIIEPMSNDPLVVETADLLREIYNQDDTGNRAVGGAYLRKKIHKKYYKLLEHINNFVSDDALQREKDYALEHIKNMMSREQEFSAFLRWAVIDSPELLDLVSDHIY